MKAIILLLAAYLCSACTQSDNRITDDETLPLDSLVKQFDNEYFTIMYPQGWAADWEEFVSDNENIARVLDSLDIRGGAVELFADDGRMGVRVVKSVVAWLNPHGTPKQWCELSCVSRQNDEDCIGMSEITEEIVIDGCPAAEVTFAYYNGRDTVIENLYAIVPQYQELYYVNIKYTKGDEEAHYIGWKMLHTLQLKGR